MKALIIEIKKPNDKITVEDLSYQSPGKKKEQDKLGVIIEEAEFATLSPV